jgi:hypothetical protein
LLRLYRIHRIKSDRYASAWASDEWTRNGITCEPSELTKSQLYLAALPILLSGQARLIDSERLRQQFVGLERRVHASGRESIEDGAASSNDDVSNCVAGLLAFLSQSQQFAGSSVMEFYRIESGRATNSGAVSPQFGYSFVRRDAPRQVKFVVPVGTSGIYGSDGRQVEVIDGIIAVPEADAPGYRRLAWQELS